MAQPKRKQKQKQTRAPVQGYLRRTLGASAPPAAQARQQGDVIEPYSKRSLPPRRRHRFRSWLLRELSKRVPTQGPVY